MGRLRHNFKDYRIGPWIGIMSMEKSYGQPRVWLWKNDLGTYMVDTAENIKKKFPTKKKRRKK